MCNYYEYFDYPCTGGSMEYELNVYPGIADTSTDFSFGFCSGESIVFSFSGSQGKIYDNDGNFVYNYQAGINNPFEIFGNAFEDYQNYSINRVPVNLNCSKTFGSYIDGFYYDNENFKFGLIVKSPQDNASEIASY